MSDESSGAVIRFGLVVGAIAGIYLIAVYVFGALHGASDILHFGLGAIVPGEVFILCAVIALVIYLVRALVLSAGGSAFALIARDFRNKASASNIITTIVIWLGFAAVMLAFPPMKIMIANVRGFPLDHLLAGLDRDLFGMDAWRITEPLFGSPLMMAFLQFCYTLWFLFMWCSIVFSMLMGSNVLRWRYSIAFFLSWILIGSLAAYLLASAGPCFYDQAFHDTRFADLMDHLRRSDAALRQISPKLALQSLGLQDMLWKGFVNHKDVFGIGISAMPSMHVATSCLMALGAYQISKPLGRAMTFFAVMIWIGSIQLGWHYAVDGIVGAAMALAIWQMAGAITARLILCEAGRTAQVGPDTEPALVQ